MKAPMTEPTTASQTFAIGASARRWAVWRVSMAISLCRVSMVGSTDMPGRSRPASASSSRSTIFTGMRWTILVKLPVALSGGSSANSWPLAGAMLSTTPCTVVAGEGIDSDIHRLAGRARQSAASPCSWPRHRLRAAARPPSTACRPGRIDPTRSVRAPTVPSSGATMVA